MKVLNNQKKKKTQYLKRRKETIKINRVPENILNKDSRIGLEKSAKTSVKKQLSIQMKMYEKFMKILIALYYQHKNHITPLKHPYNTHVTFLKHILIPKCAAC